MNRQSTIDSVRSILVLKSFAVRCAELNLASDLLGLAEAQKAMDVTTSDLKKLAEQQAAMLKKEQVAVTSVIQFANYLSFQYSIVAEKRLRLGEARAQVDIARLKLCSAKYAEDLVAGRLAAELSAQSLETEKKAMVIASELWLVKKHLNHKSRFLRANI